MLRRNAITSSSTPQLRLAAAHGTRLWRDSPVIGHRTGPEAPLEISFEGLTEEEQRRALAAFPGGRRFVLVPARH